MNEVEAKYAISLLLVIISVIYIGRFFSWLSKPDDFIRFKCSVCNKNVKVVKIREGSVHCNNCDCEVAKLVPKAAIQTN